MEVPVPVYHHRCPTCGGFELVRPMVEAATVAACPGCGSQARRVYQAPGLRSLDDGLRRALDAQDRSADAPQVVTSVPRAGTARAGGRRVQPRTTDPRHARLPRP